MSEAHTPICECNTGMACPVPEHWQRECAHVVISVTAEEYERSEATCSACGALMRNDADSGWQEVAESEPTPPPTREPIKCPNCGVARGWDKDGHLTHGIWTLNCVRCGAFTIEIDEPSPPTREPIRLTSEERGEIIHAIREGDDAGLLIYVESILAARLAGGPTLADAVIQVGKDNWPEAVTDGLTSRCCDCDTTPPFDYRVTDEFWAKWVPKRMRQGVVCLPCLNRRCGGEVLAAALLEVQWTGFGHTVVLRPTARYEYARTPESEDTE